MSQTGTPTEFLKLGITEPDDTLNVLVDLNGQWQKIDTGVKNVDTKANTNASGITALNTAVQDNTENITNILETNVNQQNSIDTLQSKVATLEQDDTDYGTRITAVEAGVQENSELINDLEVELSGVETSVGTVPSGSTLQGQVDGLDTRVTTLENSGSVAAVEARVTTLETEVGTVPSGSTVQGQITTLNGQVNSGNIPFRFSVDGGGNYGYLKADDSFVPFSSGDSHWHELDTTTYISTGNSFILPYVDYRDSTSPNYKKLHDFINNTDYTLPQLTNTAYAIGNVIFENDTSNAYIMSNGSINTVSGNVVAIYYDDNKRLTYCLTRNNNDFQYTVIDTNGNTVVQPIQYTMSGASVSPIFFVVFSDFSSIFFKYNNTNTRVNFMHETETCTTNTFTSFSYFSMKYFYNNGIYDAFTYDFSNNNVVYSGNFNNNMVAFANARNTPFIKHNDSKNYYYI